MENTAPRLQSTPAPSPARTGRSNHFATRETGIQYWSVRRVAQYLDVTPKRVYHLVQQGRLQAIRLGPRQTRINLRSLESYVEELSNCEQENFDR